MKDIFNKFLGGLMNGKGSFEAEIIELKLKVFSEGGEITRVNRDDFDSVI